MNLDSAIWLWGPLILAIGAVFFRQKVVAPVSYTHLTLPTTTSV